MFNLNPIKPSQFTGNRRTRRCFLKNQHKETTKSRMEFFYKTTVLTLTTKCHCKKIWRGYSKIKTLTLGKTDGRRRRDNRGPDGWMAPPIQSTWVWENSRRWWRTGKPGVLQSMGSHRVGHIELLLSNKATVMCDIRWVTLCPSISLWGLIMWIVLCFKFQTPLFIDER